MSTKICTYTPEQEIIRRNALARLTGFTLGELPDLETMHTQDQSFAIFNEGVYCCQSTTYPAPEGGHRVLYAIMGKVADIEFGVFDPGWEGLIFLSHRIPAALIHRIKRLMREINGKWEAECCAQIFFDGAKEEFFAHIPRQRVTRGSVRYENDAEVDKSAVKVMILHSHGAGTAFFSCIDDMDERGPQFYVVMGKNGDEHLARTFVRGREVPLRLEDLVEGSLEEEDQDEGWEIPGEWLEAVVQEAPRALPPECAGRFELPATITPLPPLSRSEEISLAVRQVGRLGMTAHELSYFLGEMLRECGAGSFFQGLAEMMKKWK
jgi:proteasome lid subunit RPN8/RPN11